MSEPIPESIPTSADPKSKRATKKRALTPVSQQANQLEALFKKPDSEIRIPDANAVAKRSSAAAPPEIVANVQGSSAGAGSGEFHVYKASRRREYERVKMMDEQVAREEADREFEVRQAERRRRDEEKTGRNRRRREKVKMKMKKGMGVGVGLGGKESGDRRGVHTGGAGGGDGDGDGHDGSDGMDVEGSSTAAPTMAVEQVGVIIHDDD